MQRAGRGGRGGDECRSSILVQASITKVVNKKSSKAGEVEKVFQMEIDSTLRKFVTTKECLWKLVDDHYENPPHEGKICCTSDFY